LNFCQRNKWFTYTNDWKAILVVCTL
jgi:hypothetical protein